MILAIVCSSIFDVPSQMAPFDGRESSVNTALRTTEWLTIFESLQNFSIHVSLVNPMPPAHSIVLPATC